MAPIHKTPSEEEIAQTLSTLKVSPSHPEKPLKKPKSKPVADSWDDDDALSSSDSSDTETEDVVSMKKKTTKAKEQQQQQGEGGGNSPHDSLQPLSTTTSRDIPPNPPPPTPASPTGFEYPYDSPSTVAYGTKTGGSGSSAPPDKRPEKTTAVAGRLIAGALGVRAPRRTEEEREYDRVMREKERKRRAEERERERRQVEEKEERKRAVWED